jgi:hypothetical protein
MEVQMCTNPISKRAPAAALLAAAIVALITNASNANPMAVCDPNRAFYSSINKEIANSEFDKALERLDNFLVHSEKNDFRANYFKGLVLLDIAVRDRKSHWPGISQLVQTAALLPRQNKTCAKEGNFYSIYNTIGFEFYSLPDLAAAKTYYELAEQNRQMLDASTYAKVLDNLGLVELLLDHNAGCAAFYFQKAGAAGAALGATHLSFANKIMSATGEKPGCFPFVYIQFADMSAAPALSAIESALVAQGYPPAALQHISSNYFDSLTPNQVKYFHAYDMKRAKELAATANSILANLCGKPQALSVLPIPTWAKNPDATTQLEIWFKDGCK